jgi:hypothetical protein
MVKDKEIKRLQAKTPQQRFLNVLENEFHYAPKVAQVLLEEAEACLWGTPGSLRPGQVRVVLTRCKAGHGRSLRDTATTEVVWTVDAGVGDRQVLQRHGRIALRHVRIQRLLDEALNQDAVATQEDLAQVLHVSLRTIKRDCACLQAQGIYLPTRGKLHGIGRGQTHKAQIVRRWLQGETYDQVGLHTHHSVFSIKRYIQTFVRVVHLQRQGFPVSQVAQLLGISIPLVREYLAVYRQSNTPACRERLEAQLQRLMEGSAPQQRPKKGVT